MKVTDTLIQGVYVIEPQVFGDNRGWFFESFSLPKLENAGLHVPVMVQENHSYSAKKGTLRGLHCQIAPAAQMKLVRCTRGAIKDVAVDARTGSPTFGKWFSLALTAENKKLLWIPKGCLHGFVTLEDDCEVQYLVDAPFDVACDRSVRYDDPVFGVEWGVDEPVLSEKDKNAPLLSASDVRFTYQEGVL